MRKEHHSKYEVFKTTEIEKEYISKIKKKCEILKYEQFIRKMQILKEKRIQNPHSIETVLENLFFYRQIYSASDNTYYPEIEPSCLCNKPFNPDKSFITCRECKELIHAECYVNSGSKNCFKCGNDLAAQLEQNGLGINSSFETYFVKNCIVNYNSTSSAEALLGNKRGRAEISDEKKPNSNNNININNNNKINAKEVIKIEEAVNISRLDSNNSNKASGSIMIGYAGEKEKHKSAHEEKSSSYPNLSEERRRNLMCLIEKLESSNNTDNADKSFSSEEKSRRTFRNKISYALVFIVSRNFIFRRNFICLFSF